MSGLIRIKKMKGEDALQLKIALLSTNIQITTYPANKKYYNPQNL